MPLYEYICKDCDQIFEVIRLMKDADAPIDCKKCGGQHTIRKISAFNAQSSGRSFSSSSCGCGSCSGDSYGSCGH